MRNGRGRNVGGGDLCLLTPEHSCTVHYNQTHYRPLSCGREEAGVNSDQAVVVAGQTGFGGDADGRSGGGTDGGGGGDRRDGTETDMD